MCCRTTGRARRARPKSSAPVRNQSRPPRRRRGRRISRLSSFRLLTHSEISEYLNALVKRVHHKHAVIAVHEKPCRQYEMPEICTAPAEVIQQLALFVEDLDYSPQPVYYVIMTFGINSDAFRPEHIAAGIANLADGSPERAGPVEKLHAKIHRVHDRQRAVVQEYFSGEIEFAFAAAGFADLLQDLPVHVQHEDLVPQRVGYINPLCRRVHGDARRPFEITFAAFQTADHAAVFPFPIKDEDLA